MPTSMDGSVYSSIFMDQYTRFTHATGLRNKSDTVEASEFHIELSHVKKYYPNMQL